MKFDVENMTCSHCVRTITRALQAIDPQAQVVVDLAAATVTVDGQLTSEQVVAALGEEGYPARAHEPGQAAKEAGCCGSCHG
jgi:copper chaperone